MQATIHSEEWSYDMLILALRSGIRDEAKEFSFYVLRVDLTKLACYGYSVKRKRMK